MCVNFCIGDAHTVVLHRHSLPGVEEQKAIKSFSKWAFLMASHSKSSSGACEPLSSKAFTESFNHTTPWFSEKTRFDFLLLSTGKRTTFSPKALFNHSYSFICCYFSFTCIYTHTSKELSFQQLFTDLQMNLNSIKISKS